MKSYSHDFKANTNQNKPCDRTVHHFGFGKIINIFGIFWQSLVCSKCYIHHHIEFCSNKTRKCNPPTKYRKNSTTYIPHYDFGTDNTQNVYTKNPHCYSVGEMSRFMATAGIWGNRYPNKPEVQIVLERRLQLLKLISGKTALVHTTQKTYMSWWACKPGCTTENLHPFQLQPFSNDEPWIEPQGAASSPVCQPDICLIHARLYFSRTMGRTCEALNFLQTVFVWITLNLCSFKVSWGGLVSS